MVTAKPTLPVSVDAESPGAPQGLPLVAPLRLNLSALGVNAGAPDFGERLFRMANDNEGYTFEYSAQGELIVMPPTGWESNIGENETNIDLGIWRRENGGYASSQTVQFQLPSGAVYIPDAAWITQERYDALHEGEYTGTIPGAPDFVVEVRSRTDNVATGLAKMQEWMDGGARLGWYIDPYERRVYIYRPTQDVEILDGPETLSGEDVLPGFAFEVRRLVFDRYRS
jgi:Uma2 family endonuclease